MNTETVKAYVSMIVAIVVNVAAAKGIQVDGDILTQVLLYVIVICVTAYAAWKNHNFTEAAQAAQGYLKQLKAGPKDESEDASGDTKKDVEDGDDE